MEGGPWFALGEQEMKKLFALLIAGVVALPILVGCGDSSTEVDSGKAIQVDSAEAGKKGAQESTDGLYN